MRATIWGILSILILASASKADTIFTINDGDTPVSGAWSYSDVGWFFRPAATFQLTGVRSQFSSMPSQAREMDLIIYHDDPTNSLNQLPGAISLFTSASGNFNGGDFATPVQLFAGHLYFVGFTNIDGVGMNVTADPSAVGLNGSGNVVAASIGEMLYGTVGGTFWANTAIGSQTSTSPILEFLGTNAQYSVPIPKSLYGSIALLCLGGALKVRKRRLIAR